MNCCTARSPLFYLPSPPHSGRTQVRNLGRAGNELPNLPRHHQEGADEGTRPLRVSRFVTRRKNLLCRSMI